MKMSGEQRIAASRQAVWEALDDPDVECEAVDRLKATVFGDPA